MHRTGHQGCQEEIICPGLRNALATGRFFLPSFSKEAPPRFEANPPRFPRRTYKKSISGSGPSALPPSDTRHRSSFPPENFAPAPMPVFLVRTSADRLSCPEPGVSVRIRPLMPEAGRSPLPQIQYHAGASRSTPFPAPRPRKTPFRRSFSRLHTFDVRIPVPRAASRDLFF